MRIQRKSMQEQSADRMQSGKKPAKSHQHHGTMQPGAKPETPEAGWKGIRVSRLGTTVAGAVVVLGWPVVDVD